MSGKRYAALVALLEQWRLDPPYSAAASLGRKSATDHVVAAERVLRRRLRTAAKPGADDDRFHRARRAGKRLRYAAELASPVMGKDAVSTIERAQGWQTRLGDFQDSVVAADLLTRLGADPNSRAGMSRFTYGVLLAQEWQRADAIRDSLRRTAK
jgi:CHAD domain-containing protein